MRLYHFWVFILGVFLSTGQAASSKDLLSMELELVGGEKKTIKALSGKNGALVVNVATKCGYTPQLEGLEELHTKLSSQVAVIGVPSNQFGGQSPGTDEEVAKYCKTKYGFKFPLTAKTDVNGDTSSELYRYLRTKGPADTRGDISWNFTKFLIDSKGKIVKRFEPGTKPSEIATYIKNWVNKG